MKNKKSSKKNELFQKKRNRYEQIIGFIPEAFVLLSGGFVKEIKKDGTFGFRSTKINEGDAFGILWGEARTLAVAELALYFPQAIIIVTSAPPKIPAIREELERLSVLKNRIILEKKSTNTLSQIAETIKIIHKKEIRRVVFITNEYHIPRVRAIYENFEFITQPDKEINRIIQKIKFSDTCINFIAAETILPYRDKKFIKIIDDMKKNIAYKKRVRNEKLGLLMIKNGEYGKNKTTQINKSERSI